MTPSERLIVALDLDSLSAAERLVKQLVPEKVTRFKVGLQLFVLAGPKAVEMVHRNGGQVFLDLKFHDIPSTVGKAVEAAARLGVWMANMHIQGGSAMMSQALIAASEESNRLGKPMPLLIGVTVLTSLAEQDLADLGFRKTLKDQVLDLAQLAKTAGLNGIVASAQEAKALRLAFGKDFLIVTPGIRPTREKDDQQRVATPLEAIRSGADYLVVGRPILQVGDPAAAARSILEECGKA